MKLKSLLLGDPVNWLQQEQIDAIEESSIKASIENRVQQSRFENQNRETAQRIYKQEQDNALLGMIVLRLLKQLSQQDNDSVENMMDEIRAAISNPQVKPALDLSFLRQALELPAAIKAPVTPAKPVAKRPVPPRPSA